MPRAARAFFALLCMAAFVCAAGPVAKAADWARVRPPQSRFTIEMPSAPEVKKMTKDTVVGDIQVTNAISKDGESLFTVSVSNLPGFVSNFVGKRTIFRNTRGEILKNFYAKKSGWSRRTRSGHKGRVLKFEVPGEDGSVAMEGTSEMYYREGKLVVITAVTPAGEAGEADRTRFLESIQVDAGVAVQDDDEA